jgi:hypothetical protein
MAEIDPGRFWGRSMATVEDVVASRGIDRLAHFTRLENVESIMEYGLVPRAHQGRLPMLPIFNDELRLDRHAEANCLSIGFPNYKMFYKLRCNVPHADWAVLALDPAVLHRHSCAFYTSNAAQAGMVCTQLADLRGPRALERLFDEIPGRAPRSVTGLSDSDPTDPQAEVLVFSCVHARFVREIWVERDAIAAQLRAAHPEWHVRLGHEPFGPRCDHAFWAHHVDCHDADDGSDAFPRSMGSPVGAAVVSGSAARAPQLDPLEMTAVEKDDAEVRLGSSVVLSDGRVIIIGQTCTEWSPVAHALLRRVTGDSVRLPVTKGYAKLTIVEVRQL